MLLTSYVGREGCRPEDVALQSGCRAEAASCAWHGGVSWRCGGSCLWQPVMGCMPAGRRAASPASPCTTQQAQRRAAARQQLRAARGRGACQQQQRGWGLRGWQGQPPQCAAGAGGCVAAVRLPPGALGSERGRPAVWTRRDAGHLRAHRCQPCTATSTCFARGGEPQQP